MTYWLYKPVTNCVILEIEAGIGVNSMYGRVAHWDQVQLIYGLNLNNLKITHLCKLFCN